MCNNRKREFEIIGKSPYKHKRRHRYKLNNRGRHIMLTISMISFFISLVLLSAIVTTLDLNNQLISNYLLIVPFFIIYIVSFIFVIKLGD